ncbi:hypothetical protein QTP86_024947, partial [Hemibagrus guttatus]
MQIFNLTKTCLQNELKILDELQQQKTTLGFTLVSQEQESKVQTQMVFSSLQLSSFIESVIIISSDSCSWLTGVEPVMVFCCYGSSTFKGWGFDSRLRHVCVEFACSPRASGVSS